MSKQPSWERLAHELAAIVMHDTYCGWHDDLPPQPDCQQCRNRALYERYLAKCQDTGRLAMKVGRYGNNDLFTVDEVMASGRRATGPL